MVTKSIQNDTNLTQGGGKKYQQKQQTYKKYKKNAKRNHQNKSNLFFLLCKCAARGTTVKMTIGVILVPLGRFWEPFWAELDSEGVPKSSRWAIIFEK